MIESYVSKVKNRYIAILLRTWNLNLFLSFILFLVIFIFLFIFSEIFFQSIKAKAMLPFTIEKRCPRFLSLISRKSLANINPFETQEAVSGLCFFGIKT